MMRKGEELSTAEDNADIFQRKSAEEAGGRINQRKISVFHEVKKNESQSIGKKNL